MVERGATDQARRDQEGSERLRRELGRMARRFCRYPEDVGRLIDRTIDEAGLVHGVWPGGAGHDADAASMPDLLSAMRRVMLAPGPAEGDDTRLKRPGSTAMTS